MNAVIASPILVAIVISGAAADPICVRYGPCPLDLSSFTCSDTSRSSFVRRVCYDARNQFMVIRLKETWYPYCGIDAQIVQALVSAPSIGSFYNENIRSKRGGAHGAFDCRDRGMPSEYR
jgi:hypothetical protein